MNKDKDFEKVAWAIEGLVMHSNGMKKNSFKESIFICLLIVKH